MYLETKIRERLHELGGPRTTDEISAMFPGAKVAPALVWLVGLGLIASPSFGVWQACDRWGQLIPVGRRPKPPKYDARYTPGHDKGQIPGGTVALAPLSLGAPRVARQRKARRDIVFPRVCDLLRQGVPFGEAISQFGYSSKLHAHDFPDWTERFREAKRCVHRLPS